MALKNKETKQGTTWVSILADAKFRIQVPEGTEGSEKREIKDKVTGQVTNVKHELAFTTMTGKITNIAFYTGTYGKNIQVDVTDDTGTLTLSVNASGKYGKNLIKKIPNIDMSKEVELSPYNFEDKVEKTKKGEPVMYTGITVKQDDKKIEEFFFDKINKKYNVENYPVMNGSWDDATDRTIYFAQEDKFLQNYIETKYPSKNLPHLIATTDIADLHKGLEIPAGEIDF